MKSYKNIDLRNSYTYINDIGGGYPSLLTQRDNYFIPLETCNMTCLAMFLKFNMIIDDIELFIKLFDKLIPNRESKQLEDLLYQVMNNHPKIDEIYKDSIFYKNNTYRKLYRKQEIHALIKALANIIISEYNSYYQSVLNVKNYINKFSIFDTNVKIGDIKKIIDNLKSTMILRFKYKIGHKTFHHLALLTGYAINFKNKIEYIVYDTYGNPNTDYNRDIISDIVVFDEKEIISFCKPVDEYRIDAHYMKLT